MREFNDFLTNDLYISPKHNEIWSQGFYTQSMDGSARIIYRSKSNFEFNKDGSFSTLKRSIISDNFSFLDCKDKEKSYHNCKHKTEKREYSYEGIEMKRIYYVTEKTIAIPIDAENESYSLLSVPDVEMVLTRNSFNTMRQEYIDRINNISFNGIVAIDTKYGLRNLTLETPMTFRKLELSKYTEEDMQSIINLFEKDPVVCDALLKCSIDRDVTDSNYSLVLGKKPECELDEVKMLRRKV